MRTTKAHCLTSARLFRVGSLFFALVSAVLAEDGASSSHDIVIYGGTSGGIVAGIQAKAMGKSVIVIEPSGHIGGLTTGGLGQTDIGNKQVIGGLAREFYVRVAKHYAQPSAWKWQEKSTYKGTGQSPTAEGEAAMWTFEPSAAATIYQNWIAETGLEMVTRERLNRESGVNRARGLFRSRWNRVARFRGKCSSMPPTRAIC